MRGISWLAENLLASQEGLRPCSTQVNTVSRKLNAAPKSPELVYGPTVSRMFFCVYTDKPKGYSFPAYMNHTTNMRRGYSVKTRISIFFTSWRDSGESLPYHIEKEAGCGRKLNCTPTQWRMVVQTLARQFSHSGDSPHCSKFAIIYFKVSVLKISQFERHFLWNTKYLLSLMEPKIQSTNRQFPAWKDNTRPELPVTGHFSGHNLLT
jgi:hypothetical protein